MLSLLNTFYYVATNLYRKGDEGAFCSLFSAAYRENYALEWPMRKGRRSREMCSNERVEAYCC